MQMIKKEEELKERLINIRLTRYKGHPGKCPAPQFKEMVYVQIPKRYELMNFFYFLVYVHETILNVFFETEVSKNSFSLGNRFWLNILSWYIMCNW